ncbi:hypothetical protein ACVW00_004217 [Marmoricola sp. URHA0025 HA25]
MIVLHAVVPADEDELHEEPLRRHDAGPVSVLYEETDEAPARDRTAVAEHGRRIVALADRVPLLPMRYGTTVHDVDDLRAVAADRADGWSRRLAQLVGRCELVVHVEVSGSDPDPVVDSGRAYLRRRMAVLQRQDRALAKARSLLARWVEEERVLPDRDRIAVLLRRHDVDAVHHVLDAWGRSRGDLAVTVTGPWPPFSFCEEADVS